MISFLLSPRLFGGEFSLFALDSNFITLGTSVHAHFALDPGEWDDPTGHDEPVAFFYLDYDNVYSVTMTNVGTDGSWGADYTYPSPTDPGTYTLGAEAPGTFDDSWDSEDATWAIIKSWSKTEVRPGVGKSETVLLYVDPPSACSFVTISTGGIVSASPGTPGSSPATVTVTGVTPSTVQYDDAVEASTPDGDAVFLPAVATVPTSFTENSPSSNSIGQSGSMLTWSNTVTVTVLDQFGLALDSSWFGQNVNEYLTESDFSTIIYGLGGEYLSSLGTLSSTGTVFDNCDQPVPFGDPTTASDYKNATPAPYSSSSFPTTYQKITLSDSAHALRGNNTRTRSIVTNTYTVSNSVN